MDKEGYDIVLECREVHHSVGAKPILHDVSFELVRGSITALVGPSGCGKSTLLRGILGTHPPTQGKIIVNIGSGTTGMEVCGPGRDRGIVYQKYSLFPFLTAQQNVALGLSFGCGNIFLRLTGLNRWGWTRKAHLEEAAELLERLGLKDAIRQYPHEMSGGMCQRVALAQALIMKPDILLLDEPFGALDNATREDLQKLLISLYWESRNAKDRGQKPPYTFLMVTHELNEAIYVSDRILGLSQYWNWGKANYEQCPGATILYDAPAPVFTVDQTPDFNRFKGQREDIRNAVFESENPVDREQYQTYWTDIASADGGIEDSLRD